MRKKYPSQIRYEQKNPTITFRVSKEEKELIEKLAKNTRKSISTLVRIALLDLQEQFTETKNEIWSQAEKDGFAKGDKVGYQKAKDQFELTFPCITCGLPCIIPPNSDCHKTVMQFLKEKGWGHGECVNKKK